MVELLLYYQELADARAFVVSTGEAFEPLNVAAYNERIPNPTYCQNRRCIAYTTMQALLSSPLAQLELDLTAAVAEPTTVCNLESYRQQWLKAYAAFGGFDGAGGWVMDLGLSYDLNWNPATGEVGKPRWFITEFNPSRGDVAETREIEMPPETTVPEAYDLLMDAGLSRVLGDWPCKVLAERSGGNRLTVRQNGGTLTYAMLEDVPEKELKQQAKMKFCYHDNAYRTRLTKDNEAPVPPPTLTPYEHGKQTERMVKRMSKFIHKVATEAAALLNEGDCKHEDGTPHNCHAVTVTILPFDRTKDGPQQLTIRTQRDWPEKWAFCLFCEHDVLSVEEIATRLSERCYEIFVSHPGFTLG